MGALAKSVSDAKLIHHIIQKVTPSTPDLSQFQFYIPPPHPSFPVNSETAQLLDQVRSFYADSYHVSEKQPPYLEQVHSFGSGSCLLMEPRAWRRLLLKIRRSLSQENG